MGSVATWGPSLGHCQLPSRMCCNAKEHDEEEAEANEDEQQQEGFFSKVGKMLRDFGMGRRSIWEGGVGAFILGGAGKLAVWIDVVW